MSEFEEKLNSILSNPESMGKIMEMARGLAGSAPKKEETAKSDSGLSLGNIDPKMIGVMTRLMKEYNTTKSDKTALLSAMKPYVRKENREALDKAGSVLKMTRLAKIALTEFGGESNE